MEESLMKPVRVGIAGLGMVAQIMHLPYLKDMDEYEIAAVCDASPKLTRYIGDYFGVAGRYTDAVEMLEKANLDAIIILTFYHSEIVAEAAKRGVHIFCEKPVSFSLKECDEMAKSVDRGGVKFMVGYMKRYDEGFLCGKREFDRMRKSGDLRMIHVHDACFQNDLAVRSMYNLRKFDDIPKKLMVETNAKIEKRLTEAMGSAPAYVKGAYRLLLETGSHDVNVLRGAFGNPEKVLHTEVWPNGNWFCTTLAYGGEVRCMLDIARTARNWGDEHITAYGMTRTVSVKFPNPFHRNEATTVHLTDMNGDATIEQEIKASHSEAFKNELIHFYNCLKKGGKPVTSLEDAREDTDLMTKIIKKYKYK